VHKNSWAVAAGLGSLALLLTACGGSSSSSAASPASTKAAGQPSTAVGLPSPGTQVLIVQKSNLGWVLAEANGTVVYTYGNDSKGTAPTCTGSCAMKWTAVTGVPDVGPVDSLPGTLSTVTMANGAKAITYNGYPLYTLKNSGALTTKGNGVDGMWHVIKLSASNITSAG
jgi:predicted lipoprotein with Yx(FWY)xxD motif